MPLSSLDEIDLSKVRAIRRQNASGELTLDTLDPSRIRAIRSPAPKQEAPPAEKAAAPAAEVAAEAPLPAATPGTPEALPSGPTADGSAPAPAAQEEAEPVVPVVAQGLAKNEADTEVWRQRQIAEGGAVPTGEARPVERTFVQGIVEPIKRGIASTSRGVTAALDSLLPDLSPDSGMENAARLAQGQREIDRYPVPERIEKEMQEIQQAKTMGEALAAAVSNPRAVLETSVESISASLPALGAALVGSLAGPAGTAIGAGLGSFSVEYASTLQDVMAERGVNGSDVLSVRNALTNPELMSAARTKATTRGIPVAVFDALTAGFAGKLLAGAKPTAGSVAGRVAGEAGLQAAGGMAGEAAAQGLTGEYKPGDIALEGFAEIPSAVPEVGVNYRHAKGAAEARTPGGQIGTALQEDVGSLQFDPNAVDAQVRQSLDPARDAQTVVPNATVAPAPRSAPIDLAPVAQEAPSGPISRAAQRAPAPPPTLAEVADEETGLAGPSQRDALADPAAPSEAARAVLFEQAREAIATGDGTSTNHDARVAQLEGELKASGLGTLADAERMILAATSIEAERRAPAPRDELPAPPDLTVPGTLTDGVLSQFDERQMVAALADPRVAPKSYLRTRFAPDLIERLEPRHVERLLAAARAGAAANAIEQSLATPGATPATGGAAEVETAQPPAPGAAIQAEDKTDGQEENGRRQTGLLAPTGPATAPTVSVAALQPGDATKKDGTPFASQARAAQAAKNRALKGHAPVQVQGGWVLRASAAQPPADTPEAPPGASPGAAATRPAGGPGEPQGTAGAGQALAPRVAPLPGADGEQALGVAAPDALQAPRPEDVAKRNGSPFLSQARAEAAARNRGLRNHAPVAVAGGWVLRPSTPQAGGVQTSEALPEPFAPAREAAKPSEEIHADPATGEAMPVTAQETRQAVAGAKATKQEILSYVAARAAELKDALAKTRGEQDFVAFDIPGDGQFKIKADPQRIDWFVGQIAKATSKSGRPTAPRERSARASSGEVSAFLKTLEASHNPQDYENAIALRESRGLPTGGMEQTLAQKRAAWAARPRDVRGYLIPQLGDRVLHTGGVSKGVEGTIVAGPAKTPERLRVELDSGGVGGFLDAYPMGALNGLRVIGDEAGEAGAGRTATADSSEQRAAPEPSPTATLAEAAAHAREGEAAPVASAPPAAGAVPKPAPEALDPDAPRFSRRRAKPEGAEGPGGNPEQLPDERLQVLLATYANERGAPSPAELSEAVRQYRQTEADHAKILRAHDEDGKPLPAPNGQPSNLNREQWILVRTPNFKRWFGDWEASNGGQDSDPGRAGDFPARVEPAHASGALGRGDPGRVVDAPRGGARRPGAVGVVDRHGEPAILYHGSAGDFSVFNLEHPDRKDAGWLGRGVYLTDNPRMAREYARLKAKRTGRDPAVLQVFAAVRAPYLATLADKGRLQRATPAQVADFTRQVGAQHDGVRLPYADAEEIVAFRPAAVKSATANAGTYGSSPDIRFRQGQAPTASGLSESQIRAAVQPLLDAWERTVPVQILPSVSDPRAPEAIRQADAQLRQAGDQVPGVFHQGAVYLFQDAIGSEREAVETLLHEALGHLGLRGVFGRALVPVLDDIVRARRPEVMAKARAYGIDASTRNGLRQAAEEVLAEMAQTRPTIGFVRRAIAAIRTWLRQHGIKLRLSDDEIIRNIILPARRFVEQGAGVTVGGGARFSRSGAKASDAILIDGREAFGEIPAEVAAQAKGQSGASLVPASIRLLHGRHEGSHKGFGLAHIEAEHGDEIRALGMNAPEFVRRAIASASQIWTNGNRLVLASTGRGRSASVIELQTDGGYYSVVTAFPVASPFKKFGKLVWRGRALAGYTRGRASGLDSQRTPLVDRQLTNPPEPLSGNDALRPPLETLRGQPGRESIGFAAREGKDMASASRPKNAEATATDDALAALDWLDTADKDAPRDAFISSAASPSPGALEPQGAPRGALYEFMRDLREKQASRGAGPDASRRRPPSGKPVLMASAPRPENAGDSKPTAEESALQALRHVATGGPGTTMRFAHPTLGEIALDYGEPGNPHKGYRGGFGFAHLLARRMAEGASLEEASDIVARAVIAAATGTVARQYGSRVDVERDGYTAVLSRQRHGQQETWVVTGFKNDADAHEQATRLARGYAPVNFGSRAQVGAAVKASIDRLRNEPQGHGEADAPRFARRGPPSANPVLDEARARIGQAPPQPFVARVRALAGRVFDVLGRDRVEHLDHFRQGWLDQFHGIARAETRNLGALPAEQSAYVAARLANGASSVMRAILLHGAPKWAGNGQHLEKVAGSEGLLDILRPLGDYLDDWVGWMAGNRAARLMTEGRERNLTAAHIQALRGLADTPEKLLAFRETARKFAAFKRAILDVAQQAGLIDPQARLVWDHADWVPFYRQMANDRALGPRGHRGLEGQSSGIRRLRGGESATNDILENIVMNFSHLIDASLKNNAVAKAVEHAPDAVEQVGLAMQGAIVPRTEIVRELKAQGMSPDLLDLLPDDFFDGVAKLWSLVRPEGEDIVRVMRDGKATFYRVSDPLLLKAMTSFEGYSFPGQGAARAARRLLTASVTATPPFMLRNFIRDTLSTAIVSKDRVAWSGALRGAVKAFGESDAAQAMLFAGASFSSGLIDGHDPAAMTRGIRRALRARGFSAASADDFVASLIDTPAKFWDGYRKVNEALENANREAVYEAVVRAGGSPTRAAFEAKDLMDFSLRGSAAAYRLLADVIPFFNARVQGLYRLGRTDPKQVAIRAGLMLAIPSLLLALANGGDDWYEELPDWDKDTYWHFMIAGQHVRLPKPFEVGYLFGSVPERMLRAALGYDSAGKAAGRVAWGAKEQLNLLAWPQILRPWIEVYSNWDAFRAAPIENMADEGKLPSARYDRNTSETVRGLVGLAPGAFDAARLGPKMVEHLIQGYFGTVGSFALSVLDAGVRQATGAPDSPSWRPDEIPLASVLYRGPAGLPPKTSQYVTDVYEAATQYRETMASVKAAAKSEGAEEAKALLERHRLDLARWEPASEAAKGLTAARKAMDAVYADRDLTPEQKRAKLDNLMAKRNALAKRAALAQKRVEERMGR